MLGAADVIEAFSITGKMVLKVPPNCPPVVILPGFGNDARDCE